MLLRKPIIRFSTKFQLLCPKYTEVGLAEAVLDWGGSFIASCLFTYWYLNSSSFFFFSACRSYFSNSSSWWQAVCRIDMRSSTSFS